MPALLLYRDARGARDDDRAAAHIQSGTAVPVDGSGPERKFRLTKLVQRGGDFERVAFEES